EHAPRVDRTVGDPLREASGREILHHDVGMIVRDAEIDDPDDMRMAHRRDQLVLEQEALEQAPAGLARPILDDLADDPLAGLLVLGEIDGREVRRIELREETVAPRAEPAADARGNSLDARKAGLA